MTGKIVTDDDARAMAAALNLAVATINAGSPMTDKPSYGAERITKIDDGDPSLEGPEHFTEKQRAVFLALKARISC